MCWLLHHGPSSLCICVVSVSEYDFQTIVDDFVTMILAGMETSANCMAFIFMELGRRPDLLQRLASFVSTLRLCYDRNNQKIKTLSEQLLNFSCT